MTIGEQDQKFGELATSNCVIAEVLRRSFLTARLLTGDATQAEKAVMEAIDVWDPGIEDEEQLFQITLRTALQDVTLASAASNEDCAADLCLPVELRRVTELSPEIRRSFVLRVLVGLPSYVCAQMLNQDIHQLDQHCRDAMTKLATLDFLDEPIELLHRDSPNRQLLD